VENNRLTKLRSKLKARKGKAGFEKNCEMIQAEIAKIEASLENTANEVALASEKKSRKAKPK
jgi:hypothetical protein